MNYGGGGGGGIDAIMCFTEVRKRGFGGNTYEHVLNSRGRRALGVSHFLGW